MGIYFVQFLHKGKQHTLNKFERKLNIKCWNTGSHLRKFMIAPGQYVMRDGKTLSKKQDLLFWGEWEPTSYIVKNYNKKYNDVNPNFLHAPFLQITKSGKVIKNVLGLPPFVTNGSVSSCSINNCGSEDYDPNNCNSNNCCSNSCKFQNTDPFVFAENMYYSLCQQQKSVVLKDLDPGSIILFGSALIDVKLCGPCFMLDTVFVVGESQDYTYATYKKDLNGFIPPYYDQIMGYNPKSNKGINYKCYKGASFNQQVQNMYSFVPCKTLDAISTGFQRPLLTANDIRHISKKLTQGFKSPKITLIDNQAIWDKLCSILRSQGYELGMNFEYITKRPYKNESSLKRDLSTFCNNNCTIINNLNIKNKIQ